MKTIIATMLFSLCVNASAESKEQKKDSNAIGALKESTELLANSDLSCNKKTDCALVAVGYRACGGPSSYVITSKNNVILDELENLAQVTVEKQKDYIRKYNIRSTCVATRPPKAACDKKLCIVTR